MSIKNAKPFLPKTPKQLQEYYDMQNKLTLKTILGYDTEEVPLEELIPDLKPLAPNPNEITALKTVDLDITHPWDVYISESQHSDQKHIVDIGVPIKFSIQWSRG